MTNRKKRRRQEPRRIRNIQANIKTKGGYGRPRKQDSEAEDSKRQRRKRDKIGKISSAGRGGKMQQKAVRD